MTTTTQPAKASGEFLIAGKLPVTRLGFGAMQITGPGVWGDPKDPDEAIRVLRRAVEMGVNLIDTADSYGPVVSEQLIHKALHPYPDDLVIATKAGLTRTGPGKWHPVGRPEYLRQQCEMSLRHLGLDRIPVFQLHRIDPKVALEDQIGELGLLQSEGKIGHIGLSEVSVDEIVASGKIAEIATVQNLYNVASRKAEPVVAHCEANNIGFIPWIPLASGHLAKKGSVLANVAEELGSTPSQLALAWLLRRSPVMLPIPGTSTVAHLEENIAGALVELSDDEFDTLTTSAAG